MKNSSLISLGMIAFALLSQSGCQKEQLATDPKPSGARSGPTTLSYGLGDRFTGSGQHVYQYTLDFTGTCTGSQVTFHFIPEDVPNSFVVKDNNGVTVAHSGNDGTAFGGHNYYIGHTDNMGPWGSPFTTPGTETATFSVPYDENKIYTLYVETVTQNGNTDSWSIDYLTTSCGEPEPPVCTKSGACGQFYSGSHDTPGNYVYADQPLDLSNVCNGAMVHLTLSPGDVPNHFMIKDNLNTSPFPAESGRQSNTTGHGNYIGHTDQYGPWGPPFSTGGDETISFVYDETKTYRLIVETNVAPSPYTVTDGWSVQIFCTN